MTMSLNKEISLTGVLGRDPEGQYTDQGTMLCKFSIAVTVGSGDNKSTEWYDIVAWGKQGEILHEYLTKGSKVQVRGDFKLNLWKSKDGGEPRGKVVVTVRDFQFLSIKKKEEVKEEEELPEFMQD
jgi:single-strand DNA-binding protein